MESPTIWLVGDWQVPEFADAGKWLRESATCRSYDSPQSAAHELSAAKNANVPVAIVVAVARPGRFAAHEIEHLYALLPLTRLVALTGPWCEGEQRSGIPWPGIVRVAWRTWHERLPSELGINVTGAAQLPRTATEIERVERSLASIRTQTPRRGIAAIRTHSIANHRYLADAATQLGLTVPTHSDESVAADVLICDGWENLPPVSESNAPLHREPAQRSILMLHFPRPADQSRAQQAGIHAIVAQPPLLSDLAAALGE